jgi:hypothetical protein
LSNDPARNVFAAASTTTFGITGMAGAGGCRLEYATNRNTAMPAAMKKNRKMRSMLSPQRRAALATGTMPDVNIIAHL